MNRIVLMFQLFYLLLIMPAWAQKGKDAVFSYGNHEVSLEEFKRGFLKNLTTESSLVSKEDVMEYLQLYTQFKLKVQDAYDRRMDTTMQFKNELMTYRKQIARPFLTDKSVTDDLLQEAYVRSLTEVDASHILVNVPSFENPLDTLKAYRHLDSIRQLIIGGKMTFESAADLFSHDPSARSNKGNLGYFTVFQLVYPFESMAYETAVGEVSPIFRTRFGYHILKVNDKRKSLGEITVAHLVLILNQNATPEEKERSMKKAQEIYDRIKSGEKSFEEMVRLYTEDNGSKFSEGRLEPFKMTSQYPEEFKKVAFALSEDGEISTPFASNFGVHIIKRISLDAPAEFAAVRNRLIQDVNRDSRSSLNTRAVFDRVSRQLQLKHQDKNFKAFVNKDLNAKWLKGEWEYIPKKSSQKILFTFAQQKVTVSDFARHLMEVQKKSEHPDYKVLAKEMYDEFVVQTVISHYEERLQDYNMDFKFLLKEYTEGILLFSLMDELVWTRSVSDSVGLEAFFKNNQRKHRWEARLDMSIFETESKKVATQLGEMMEKKVDNDSIISFYKRIDPLAFTVQRGKFSKGDNEFADQMFSQLKGATYDKDYQLITEGNMYYILRIHQYMPPMNKELNDVRGPVISDYQDVLEKQWLSELKSRYPVKVNTPVLDKLILELTKS